MHHQSVDVPRLFIFTIFALLMFSASLSSARAQNNQPPPVSSEPDAEIKRQMIAYVAKLKKTQPPTAPARPTARKVASIGQINMTSSTATGQTQIAAQQNNLPARQIVRWLPATAEQSPTFKSDRKVSDSALSPVSSSLAAAVALERRAFALLNEQRVANRLEPLKWNEEMAQVARLHSENMARGKFFSHTGLDGKTVGDRASALGIDHWRAIGENINYNRGFQKPAESVCAQWMKSPAHRENLLDVRWNQSAIGAAIAADGTFYFTQVFILR